MIFKSNFLILFEFYDNKNIHFLINFVTTIVLLKIHFNKIFYEAIKIIFETDKRVSSSGERKLHTVPVS